MLCGVALGCNQSSPPASGAKSTTDKPTTVTANRPITTEHPAATNEPVDRTNTGVNVRDRDSTAKTPIDQNENTADIKITADIRRAIMDDKSMSVNAQNCKIITDKSGMVTLRGVVNSQAEKDMIESKAKAIAGVTKVDNQLEVKSN